MLHLLQPGCRKVTVGGWRQPIDLQISEQERLAHGHRPWHQANYQQNQGEQGQDVCWRFQSVPAGNGVQLWTLWPSFLRRFAASHSTSPAICTWLDALPGQSRCVPNHLDCMAWQCPAAPGHLQGTTWISCIVDPPQDQEAEQFVQPQEEDEQQGGWHLQVWYFWSIITGTHSMFLFAEDFHSSRIASGWIECLLIKCAYNFCFVSKLKFLLVFAFALIQLGHACTSLLLVFVDCIAPGFALCGSHCGAGASNFYGAHPTWPCATSSGSIFQVCGVCRMARPGPQQVSLALPFPGPSQETVLSTILFLPWAKT